MEESLPPPPNTFNVHPSFNLLRVRNNKQNTIRQDTTIATLHSLQRLNPPGIDHAAKMIEVLEAQNGQEAETYRSEQELKFIDDS